MAEKEKKHWHSAKCFERKQVCFKPEHTHTTSCYGGRDRRSPTCGVTPHTHGGNCFLNSTNCGY